MVGNRSFLLPDKEDGKKDLNSVHIFHPAWSYLYGGFLNPAGNRHLCHAHAAVLRMFNKKQIGRAF